MSVTGLEERARRAAADLQRVTDTWARQGPAGVEALVRSRRARWRIVTAAVAVAAVVVFAVVTWWPAPSPAPVVGPAPDGQASDPGVDPSWRWVTVGGGRFAVPPDWDLIDLAERSAGVCALYFGEPAVVVGPEPTPPIPCPGLALADPAMGIRAMTAGDAPWDVDEPEAEPVAVNGHDGMIWRPSGTVGPDLEVASGFSEYLFPNLDLFLRVRTDLDPDLAARIVGTLEAVRGPVEKLSTSQPSEIATMEYGQRRHRADLDGDGRDDVVTVDTRVLSEDPPGRGVPVLSVQFATGQELSVEIADEVILIGTAPWLPGHLDLGADGREEVFVIGSGETGGSVALVAFDPDAGELYQVGVPDAEDGLLIVGNSNSGGWGLTCRGDGLLEWWTWELDADGRPVAEILGVYDLVDRVLQRVEVAPRSSMEPPGGLDCPQAIEPGI